MVINMGDGKPGAAMAKKRGGFFELMYRHRYLYFMSVPFVIHICIFQFGPIYGWLMAFKDYNINLGVWGSPWVGLKHFRAFFADLTILNAIRNTVVLSVMGIITRNTFPLVLALLLNELKNGIFKKVTQTISYLPHFVSFAVVGSIFLTFMSTTGPLNDLLVGAGFVSEPVRFLWSTNLYWVVLTGIGVWKEVGWGAIIYLAAICAVDPELHDAAKVDGCKRFRRAWHVTLPGVLPTCVILGVTSVAGILGSNFEAGFIFGNPANRQVSEVISTYIFRYGLGRGMYSFATAVSLMQTLIGFGLVYVTNRAARKLVGYSLW